jgi:predicted nucleic acid-binding protein
MSRILFDTNVVLEVLLDRQPHAAASAAVWSVVETGAVEGSLSAHAVTTIHYLIRKQLGEAKAKRTVAAIMRVFGITAIDGPVLGEALQLRFTDFEDAVTSAAAASAGCDWIVTRDARGFRGSSVRALTPGVLLPLLIST